MKRKIDGCDCDACQPKAECPRSPDGYHHTKAAKRVLLRPRIACVFCGLVDPYGL